MITGTALWSSRIIRFANPYSRHITLRVKSASQESHRVFQLRCFILPEEFLFLHGVYDSIGLCSVVP